MSLNRMRQGLLERMFANTMLKVLDDFATIRREWGASFAQRPR
jgi:hypothetical protein